MSRVFDVLALFSQLVLKFTLVVGVFWASRVNLCLGVFEPNIFSNLVKLFLG